MPEEKALLLRFKTERVALRDDPLLLEDGVRRGLPCAEAPPPAPAPEDEPAVVEATAATAPVWADCM
jgi:hypothetical protein